MNKQNKVNLTKINDGFSGISGANKNNFGNQNKEALVE